jgi:glyoxylase-like metal-dependent hydrolase (beta-lactamase superfamily II)
VRIEPDDPSGDWTAPGVYEVAAGLYRIPLPLPMDGLRAVNVYALRDGERLTMIDAGWSIPEARATLDKAVTALGHGLGDLHRFLVTHVHRDHYTLAVQLRRDFGNRVFLGIGERESLAAISDPDREPFETAMAKLMLAGAGPLVKLMAQARQGEVSLSEWEPPDEWLRPPVQIELDDRKLSAIHTPGHTQGHLVFADDANGQLFAGDHVLPHITPSIGLEGTMARSPLADYLESLRLVRGRPDQVLLPAHGPVSPSVHQRVDELLAHHAQRLDEMAAAVESGTGTAYETAQAVLWTRRGRKFSDLDPMNQGLATTETAAHLDLLFEQGRLRRTQTDGVRTYRV